MLKSALGYMADAFSGFTDDALAAWAKRSRFSKFLPWVSYDPDAELYYNQDGTVGFAFQCNPLPGANEEIAMGLTALLEGLPEGTVISVTLISTPHLKPLLDAHKALKIRAGENELLREALDRTVAFWENGSKGLPHLLGVPIRNFRLIFTFKWEESYLKKQKLKPVDLRISLKEDLEGLRVSPRNMPPDELIQLHYLLFNGQHEENIGWDEDRYISESVISAESDIVPHKDFLRIGERYFKCITPKKITEDPSLTITSLLTGGLRGPADDANQIPTHFLYSVVVVKDNSIPSKIRNKAIFFKKQAEGDKSVLASTTHKYAKEHLQAVDEMERGKQFYYSIPIMWVFDDDKERVFRASKRVKRLMTQQGYVGQEERSKKLLGALFISALPFGFYNYMGNMENIDRYYIAKGEATASQLPIVGDYIGGGNPHMFFISRKGQLVTFDPFDSAAANKNFIVMGKSGGGKSFTLNDYVRALYSSGAICRVFDVAYSYEKMCTMLKGYYLDLGAGRKNCINQFSYIPDGVDSDELSYHLDTIGSIVAIMAYANTEKDPNEIEHTLIKLASKHAWAENGPEAGIDDIHHYLSTFPKNAKDEIELFSAASIDRITDIAHMLAFNLTDWTRGGDFGEWFNGPATVDLKSAEFMVVELEKLMRIRSLFRVVSLAMMNATSAMMYLLPRGIKKLNVFEECGVVLKGNKLYQDIVEEAYRRGRKNNVCTGTVFQGPLDLPRLGVVGDTILGNSEFHLYLPSDQYKKATSEKLQVLDYPEGVGRILASLKTSRPRYSEIAIRTPYTSVPIPVRVIADGFGYYLNTSDAEDWAQLQEVAGRHGGDMIRAISDLAHERDRDIALRYGAQF
jgi:conjugal transfer ATP-binding protein TraC